MADEVGGAWREEEVEREGWIIPENMTHKSMFCQYWATVRDAGARLKQHKLTGTDLLCTCQQVLYQHSSNIADSGSVLNHSLDNFYSVSRLKSESSENSSKVCTGHRTLILQFCGAWLAVIVSGVDSASLIRPQPYTSMLC